MGSGLIFTRGHQNTEESTFCTRIGIVYVERSDTYLHRNLPSRSPFSTVLEVRGEDET